jgi:hypothetical protein
LAIVYPKMFSAALAAGTSLQGRPMTTASSPSKWTGLALAGNWIGMLGPMIEVFGLRKITGSGKWPPPISSMCAA